MDEKGGGREVQELGGREAVMEGTRKWSGRESNGTVSDRFSRRNCDLKIRF